MSGEGNGLVVRTVVEDLATEVAADLRRKVGEVEEAAIMRAVSEQFGLSEEDVMVDGRILRVAIDLELTVVRVPISGPIEVTVAGDPARRRASTAAGLAEILEDCAERWPVGEELCRRDLVSRWAVGVSVPPAVMSALLAFERLVSGDVFVWWAAVCAAFAVPPAWRFVVDREFFSGRPAR